MLPPTVQDGRQQQEAPVHPRGHQLHISQRGNSPLPPSNLSQGPHGKDGVMAYSGTGYVFRWGFGRAFLVVLTLSVVKSVVNLSFITDVSVVPVKNMLIGIK